MMAVNSQLKQSPRDKDIGLYLALQTNNVDCIRIKLLLSNGLINTVG